MRREINPETFPKPQSNYSQGVVHGPIKERLVISGQVGVRPDGSVAEGLEAQMAQTWENFLAVLGSAGFQTADVVKVTVYVTEPALQEFALFKEDFLLVRPPSEADKPVPGPDRLREMRLLLLEEGHCFRDQALSFCETPAAAEPRYLMEGSSLSTLVQMVGAGIGVTLIPEMAVDTGRLHT